MFSGAAVLRVHRHCARPEQPGVHRQTNGRGFARAIEPGLVRRGRLYHLQHRPLYEAIGQADNRKPPFAHDWPDGRTADDSRCCVGRSTPLVVESRIRQARPKHSFVNRPGLAAAHGVAGNREEIGFANSIGSGAWSLLARIEATRRTAVRARLMTRGFCR